MHLKKVLAELGNARTLSAEHVAKLNNAIFNLEDEDEVTLDLVRRIFEEARRIHSAYTNARLGPEVRPEFLALLGTLQNQQFFSARQYKRLHAWMCEVLSQRETEAMKLAQLEQRNKALREECEKYLALEQAVAMLQHFRTPAAAAVEATGAASVVARAKATSRRVPTGPEWQVQTDFGWQGYSGEVQVTIQAVASSGATSCEIFTNGQYYRIDFARMMQINPLSHRERPIRFFGADPPTPAMPKLNFKRLMAEFKQVERAIGTGDEHGLHCCEPVEDSLLEWRVEMTFASGSKLQSSLENLAASMFDGELGRVQLCVRFPVEYPISPPEVWLRRPRMKHQSGPVSFGGRICTILLASAGWLPQTSMLGVLAEVRSALVEADLEAETAVTVRREYPQAPTQLQRLTSELYPTKNGFCKDGMTVLSPGEAVAFLGDISRLEATDKIGLPFSCADEIYGRAEKGGELELPFIFEVKSLMGRKTHCAIFEFIEGLPAMHALLPKWVMEDLDIEEREPVRVRGVSLSLITYVKVQPHSMDFYGAVRDSGREVHELLTESLSRFSALTEDNAVPIEIGDKTYSMQIVECRPHGSVRIIDSDVQHHFEFEVDFEPAPDLEDESATKAHQDRIIQAFKLRRERSATNRQEMKDKRAAAREQHFEDERERLRALAAVESDDGATGDVDIVLRLPNGTKLPGKFREGAPMAAVISLVLGTPWAAESLPWGVHLRVFPNKVLPSTDTVTKDLHRAAISVQEEQAPTNDDELLAVLRDSRIPADMIETTIEEFEPPPLSERDEQQLEARTQRAFEVQRFIRAGYDPNEAAERYAAGEILPPRAPTRAEPRPPLSLRPAPSPRAAPVPLPLQRSVSEADECEKRVQEVMNFTGVDHEMAEEALKNNDWITESAVNSVLDSLV